MKHDRFAPFDDDEGFDLDGVGLTIEELDLSITIDADDLAPFCDWSRWKRPRRWWNADRFDEDHGCPPFNSIEDRASWFITAMGRGYLETIGAHDTEMVFEFRGEMVSLNDLLAIVGDPIMQMIAMQ